MRRLGGGLFCFDDFLGRVCTTQVFHVSFRLPATPSVHLPICLSNCAMGSERLESQKELFTGYLTPPKRTQVARPSYSLPANPSTYLLRKRKSPMTPLHGDHPLCQFLRDVCLMLSSTSLHFEQSPTTVPRPSCARPEAQRVQCPQADGQLKSFI